MKRPRRSKTKTPKKAMARQLRIRRETIALWEARSAGVSHSSVGRIWRDRSQAALDAHL